MPLHQSVTNCIFVHTTSHSQQIWAPCQSFYLLSVTLTHSMTVKPLWHAVGKLLLHWQRVCSGFLHTLLDYPLFSCQTHSSQLQKAGQSGTQVRWPHLSGDMWPIICFLRFSFFLSSEVVIVRNVGSFSFVVFLCSARHHILDGSLQDSKMLISRESGCKDPAVITGSVATVPFNSWTAPFPKCFPASLC